MKEKTKIFALLLVFCLIFINIYAAENIEFLRSSLDDATDIERSNIYYKLASQTDSLEISERLNYCKQAKNIAIKLDNSDLLFDILSLESEIYKEASDINNYSSSIQEYIEIYKKKSSIEMENSKKQITKQIIIRNSFMIGFIIFLNIAFIIFARYRLKTLDHIKLEKANVRLEKISRKDPLTNISNRRDILEKIEYETIRFERNKKSFCIVMGDIDHFKSVNDTYGHECGDYVLKELVNAIVASIRKQDIVGRWGGEEFILLLPETQIDGGKVAAEKIRRKIAHKEFIYNNKRIPITITFGISEYSNDKDIDGCIKEADTALYKGKNKGRNRVEVFNPREILIG